MSRILFTLLTVLFWFSVAAQQQGENIILDQAINGGQHTYTATQSVRMVPGFSYKPVTGGEYFKAWIEKSPVIFPPDGIIGGDPDNNYGGLPGTLPGNLMVSSSGAAVYNIPIDLPQGVAGLTPQLALVYNSQGGNGLLGMGWSLSGLSGISRTGKTIYHDGKVEGIQFNTTDNYVLDGQRLMPVNASKTEYRTEVESFMRILPQQIVGGEPGWFKVQTKSGQTLYYGKEPHSRIEATDKQKVMNWLLDRIEDPLGNYVQLTYQEEGGMGIIKKIEYGANQTTGQSHVYEVTFSYTTNRTDKHKKYIGGSYVETKYLLEKINIKRVGQQTLYHYKLDYDLVFYPRMQYVWLYQGDTETEFFNPTKMEWGSTAWNGFQRYPHFEFINGDYESDDFFLDINGDGLTDKLTIVYWYYEHGDYKGKVPVEWFYRTRINKSTFSDAINIDNLPSSFFSHLIITDFNGDGMDDFACFRFGHENMQSIIFDKFTISNGAGFNVYNIPNGGIQSDQKDYYSEFHSGDFDGDGKSEILLARKRENGEEFNVFIYKLNEQTNNFDKVVEDEVDFGNASEHRANLVIADFNGDGRSDMLRTAEYGGNPHKHNCFVYQFNFHTGKKEFLFENFGYPTNWHQIYPGDFNGDGITDILTYNYTAQNPVWEIQLSTGTGIISMNNVPDLGHFDLTKETDAALNKLSLSDFNNDGKTDIIHMWKEDANSSTAHHNIFFSNGTEFPVVSHSEFSFSGKFQVWINDRQFINHNVVQVLDFNGDAFPDFYLFKQRSSTDIVLLHNPTNTFNRVLGFTNGFGEQVRPHYQPLTNKTIYTKGTTASYPLRDIQPPLYVVSEVARETVDYGLQTTEQYTYQGAKVHLQGKGYLGFEKRRIHQLRQNTIAEEINAVYQPQNKYFYPYNASSNTYVAKTGFKLSETINTINHQANANEPKVFFPFIEKSNGHAYEYFSGEHQVSTRTIMSFNEFGNPTVQNQFSDSVFMSAAAPSTAFNHQSTTETQYISDTDNWIFRPEVTDTKVRYHSKTLFLNKTVYEYFPPGHASFPLLKSQKDHPEGNTNHELTTQTDYTYDIYGNPTSVTLSAPHDPSSPAPRTTTMAYHSDYKHRLLTSTTNPLGYVSSFTYDDAYGWKLTETDPNGFETSFIPHPFGTESMTTLPDGSRQGTALRWAHKHPDAPDNATYYSWQKETGNAPLLVFYHKTGAELRRISTGLDGSLLYTDTYYDEKDRLHKTSLPYIKEDKKKYYTTYGYDDIGRTTMVEAPDGTRTITRYNNNSVTTTNALGQSNSRQHNAAGWLTKSTDALGTEVKYSYFSDGKLHQTMIASAPSTLITLS
ncbi:MAG: FG-GAP-like repeat-containing protein, partial [Acidaminococcaceae bacterium]